jgi:tetratricopeptide (TPR) repeat protein
VLYNKPVKLRKPVHKALASTISHKGIDAAIKQYDELKKDTVNYYIEWWNIDQLGHQLYDMKRYKEALLLFEKNAQEFPERDIALVSLGQTYEVLGRKEDAILYYKKAIAVNPGNEEAKNRLKNLEKDK